MNKPINYLCPAALLLVSFCFFTCKKLDNSPHQTKTETQTQTSVNTTPLTSYVAAGGGHIVIKGTNLLAGAQAPKVTINGKSLTISNATNDSLTVTIPKLLGSGRIVLTVNNKSYESEFTYEYSANVTTIAGNGAVGTNDGPALSANFNCPWGMTVDDNGDLYIADSYNRLIRKLSAADGSISSIGIPVLVAGNNFFSPYNITLDHASHDFYVTDFNEHLMKMSDGNLSVIYNGTMPTTGIVVGPDGYLYMSNNTKGGISKLNKDGSVISTFAMNIFTPRNIIFDGAANMYVAGYDIATASAAIFKVDYKAETAQLLWSDKAFGGWEIAVDSAGNFYEADHFNNVIKMIDVNGTVSTIAGSGAAADTDGDGLNASFNGPMGLTIDAAGNLYVTTYNFDTAGGNKVRKIVLH